jgi:hypothetical protein
VGVGVDDLEGDVFSLGEGSHVCSGSSFAISSSSLQAWW